MRHFGKVVFYPGGEFTAPTHLFRAFPAAYLPNSSQWKPQFIAYAPDHAVLQRSDKDPSPSLSENGTRHKTIFHI